MTTPRPASPPEEPGVAAIDPMKLAARVRYKRPFDLLIVAAAHVLLAPVWLLLWALIPLAVKLGDGGPVFYRQTRVGKDGRTFSVLKFRTMVPDAEREAGAVWASAADPRLTRVGRVLRKTALDELPQVLSIWMGDMSLVGPRPERAELHERFVKEFPGFEQRLLVPPGLTGLAQVHGAYDLSPGDKLRYDMEYVRTMSPRVDVELLIRSVLNTLRGRWDERKDGGGGAA